MAMKQTIIGWIAQLQEDISTATRDAEAYRFRARGYQNTRDVERAFVEAAARAYATAAGGEYVSHRFDGRALEVVATFPLDDLVVEIACEEDGDAPLSWDNGGDA